jgi:hypothetical protein
MSKARWMVLCAVLVSVLGMGLAAAQDDELETPNPEELRTYTVAVFAPDINFSDSISKSGFVGGVASALASRTGLKWRGLAFANAGDLKSSGVDYAIIGGSWCAVACIGKPVAFASGSGAMSIVGRGGKVSEMRGKTLILPQPAKAYEGFVTATLLGGEIAASEFFKIKTTGDVRSAIAAVNVGAADLTVAFDAYAGGLSVLYRSNASPLPVATQVNTNIEPEIADRIAKAFRGLPASGGGIIRGFGGGGGGVKAFRGSIGGTRVKRPGMMPPRPLKLRFPVIKSTGLERLVDSRHDTIIHAPALVEEDP